MMGNTQPYWGGAQVCFILESLFNVCITHVTIRDNCGCNMRSIFEAIKRILIYEPEVSKYILKPDALVSFLVLEI